MEQNQNPGLGALRQDAVIAGTYRIVRLLGRGGMGEVFEAVHERTGAPLAIKVLLEDFSKRSEVLARFQREARITSRLRHPNIVTVFDFASLPDGRPYLVMELLSGADLGRLLETAGPIDPGRVVAIVDQVALALAATHDAGVVHRDLSPGNIFIERLPGTDREQVRVLDFGISKVRDAQSALTQTKMIMGTPHYMSPEQALGHTKQTDARADQFALAAITYELLTGRRAFASDDPAADDPAPAVLYRVVHGEPPRFASLGLNLPAAVERVVWKALAKNPSDRYPSIVAFSNALAIAVHEGRPETRKPPAVEARGGGGSSAQAEALSPPWPLSGATLRLADEARPPAEDRDRDRDRDRSRDPGRARDRGRAGIANQQQGGFASTEGGVSTTLRKATGEMAAFPAEARHPADARRVAATSVAVGVAAAVVIGLGVAAWFGRTGGVAPPRGNQHVGERVGAQLGGGAAGPATSAPVTGANGAGVARDRREPAAPAGVPGEDPAEPRSLEPLESLAPSGAEPAPTTSPAARFIEIPIEEAPSGTTVWEGDRRLALPLRLPPGDGPHHLTFRAPGRQDLSIDVPARDGERVSLSDMQPVRGGTDTPRARTRPSQSSSPSSSSSIGGGTRARPRSGPRNEDI